MMKTAKQFAQATGATGGQVWDAAGPAGKSASRSSKDQRSDDIATLSSSRFSSEGADGPCWLQLHAHMSGQPQRLNPFTFSHRPTRPTFRDTGRSGGILRLGLNE
jgi:hypothetical protein